MSYGFAMDKKNVSGVNHECTPLSLSRTYRKRFKKFAKFFRANEDMNQRGRKHIFVTVHIK